jgi:hypothetical protein
METNRCCKGGIEDDYYIDYNLISGGPCGRCEAGKAWEEAFETVILDDLEEEHQ